jgi:hypothetical protein
MPKRLRIFAGAGVLALMALAGAWFLNGPDGPDGAGPAIAGPVDPYLRLALSRDASSGAVDITRSAVIESAVRPLTGMGGYYAVLDGNDGVLSASPFAFPTHEIDEYRDADGAMVMAREIELTSQSVIVFLPFEESATAVRILDASGAVVASLDTASLDVASVTAASEDLARGGKSRARGMLDGVLSVIETPLEAASLADLEAQFPHILFGSSFADLSGPHQGSVEEVIPIDAALVVAPYMADALFDALSELGERSPLLLGSIASIALVEYPDAGIFTIDACSGPPVEVQRGASAVGNQIVINFRDSIGGDLYIVGADVVRTGLAHESVHAFNRLMDNANHVVQERLPQDVLTRVNDFRGNVGHLDGVMSGTWGQMQASAQVAYGGYGGYEDDNWKCAYASDAEAVEAGFKRPYGSKSVFEDVATYVELFYDENQPFASHGVCQQFSGLTDEVPRPQLLAFAKLNFLRGVELISEADYEACVQNADPANEDGFSLADGDYTQGLKAGGINQESNIINAEEGSRFVVLGSTSTARAMLQIFARPPFYSPVGFHRLDNTVGWLTPYQNLQGLKRRDLLTWQPTNTDGNIELTRMTRISSGGFALIVNNSPVQAKGYAFFVPMEDWLGRQTTVLDLVWFRLESN